MHNITLMKADMGVTQNGQVVDTKTMKSQAFRVFLAHFWVSFSQLRVLLAETDLRWDLEWKCAMHLLTYPNYMIHLGSRKDLKPLKFAYLAWNLPLINPQCFA